MNCLLCGVGGQGTVLASKLLAQAAIDKGISVKTAETIGKKLGINKIYSRVKPMVKLEIVNNLKADDEFVAVTGDGVNDVPAL